jgi:hypothetical protein
MALQVSSEIIDMVWIHYSPLTGEEGYQRNNSILLEKYFYGKKRCTFKIFERKSIHVKYNFICFQIIEKLINNEIFQESLLLPTENLLKHLVANNKTHCFSTGNPI